jgi:hypothetical protein
VTTALNALPVMEERAVHASRRPALFILNGFWFFLREVVARAETAFEIKQIERPSLLYCKK